MVPGSRVEVQKGGEVMKYQIVKDSGREYTVQAEYIKPFKVVIKRNLHIVYEEIIYCADEDAIRRKIDHIVSYLDGVPDPNVKTL